MKNGFGIAGIGGRMGRLLVEEVRAAGGVVVGGVDRPGTEVEGERVFASIAELAAVAEVVLDFSNAAAVAGHADALAEAGTAWVLGTTGLSAEDEAAVARAAGRCAVVHSPNFSPGVNLVLALAERMAAALPAEQYDAEILEMHHRQKVDAPSGTALGIGRAVAKGRGVDFESVRLPGREGATGARPTGAIGFAALRGGQVVGEHTLLFAAANEQISLTHRAFDRRAFATGAVRAAFWVRGRASGLYSMMDVLGMR